MTRKRQIGQLSPFLFFQLRVFPAAACRSNIEMTPLCKVDVTLPEVRGALGVRDDGGVDEQEGIQSARSSAGRSVWPETVAKLGVRRPPRRPRTAPRLRPRFPPASKPKPCIHARSENERGNTRPPSHPQSRDSPLLDRRRRDLELQLLDIGADVMRADRHRCQTAVVAPGEKS